MKILFYIEKTLTKLVIFTGASMVGVYFLTLAIGIRNILEYKITILELLGIIFVIYMLPKKKDRFGFKVNDSAFVKYKDLTEVILVKTYSPSRAIPRIILILTSIAVLIYVLHILYSLILGIKI